MRVILLVFFLMSSVAFTQECNDTIIVPNSFTPTLDKNYMFLPYTDKDYIMEVYNRWGELIYVGREWNGTSKKTDCERGTYIWKIRIYDEDCFKDFNGCVNLIK
jgi:hypothetical protein